jgi:hypothetical protein
MLPAFFRRSFLKSSPTRLPEKQLLLAEKTAPDQY